jgi:hypothetical protein
MRIVRILAFCVLVVLGIDRAAAQPAALPSGAQRPAAVAPSPSADVAAIHRPLMRSDTFDERAAFLARRQAEMERQKVERVAPLPAQRITPAPLSAP